MHELMFKAGVKGMSEASSFLVIIILKYTEFLRVSEFHRVSLANQLIWSQDQPGCASARIHSRPRRVPQLGLKINYNCGSNYIMHATSSNVELRSTIDA